jgi:5,10-methylenetetrahydromethanopterin reductase
MIEFAGRTAERITFALGADLERLAWGIDLARSAANDAGRDPDDLDLGAYVNVGCNPDLDVARSMVRGAVAAFAHFSAMPGSTGAGLAERDREVVARVGEQYDSNQHLRTDAGHTDALDDDFTDRFAICGPPDTVIERLRRINALGIGRCVVTGPDFGTAREHADSARRLVAGEVLPAVHEFEPTSAPARKAPTHA